jgi:hypothetical protein
MLVGFSVKSRRIGATRMTRRRSKDKMEIDLRKIGKSAMNWIDLAQDREKWRALVNTVMNFDPI